MKLSELIACVGDDHVNVQNLQESMVSISHSKNTSTISFGTSRDKGQSIAMAALTGAKPEFIGLIVWIPRERLPNEANLSPTETASNTQPMIVPTEAATKEEEAK